MKLKGHTVLITGGASGIGLAIAEKFLEAGSEVIVCGRREDKLKEAKQKFPGLHTIVTDVATASERTSLFNKVIKEFPKLNVLVNNAGIQDMFQIKDLNGDWERHHKEIAINLEAPIHLSMLFIPHLQKVKDAAIVNISSGLAFNPGAFAPVYSATKAALHSFTMSLRHQLAAMNIQVIEIVPPAVDTDLGGRGLHTYGVNVNDFTKAVMQRFEAGELEIGYGGSEKWRNASREELNEAFKMMNKGR